VKRIFRNKTLLGVAAFLIVVATANQAFAAEPSDETTSAMQGGETTQTLVPGAYVTTTPDDSAESSVAVYPPCEDAASQPSDSLEASKAETEQAEPAENVPVVSTVTTSTLVQPVVKKVEPKPSLAKHTAPIIVKRGRYGLPSNAKRYSLKKLKAIVSEVGKKMGCTKAEIRMLKYIFQRECRNNKGIGGSNNHFLGMWQLYYTMCKGKPWWDPYWQTRRAIRYMRNHRYAGYGKGIAAAYLNKVNRGWY